MIYLLDTNIVLALQKDMPSRVREHYAAATASGAEVAVSSIVLFELWYGTARSAYVRENTERIRDFLSGAVSTLPFDDEDAEAAGKLRAMLEAEGKPIGPFDVLIAGQALRRKATLVTANAREFGRVRALVCEDWTR